jgi:hypothetical protein
MMTCFLKSSREADHASKHLGTYILRYQVIKPAVDIKQSCLKQISYSLPFTITTTEPDSSNMSTRGSDVLEKEKYQPCVPTANFAALPVQTRRTTSPNKHGVAEALLFVLQGEKRLRRFTGKKSQGVEEKKLHVNFSGRLRLVEVSSHGKVRERR